MARIKVNKYDEYMPPLQNPMDVVQMNEDGSMRNVDYQPERKVTFRDKLTNALLGKQAAPTDSIDVDNMSAGISANPRVGGLLNDISSGYRENYNNRFNLNNFGDNDIDFDRKKGFGYRLGEGLGSVGRFIDSPLGRFALAAGLNSALGYNNSLQEGLTAAVGRQQNQTMDNLYRNQLKRDYGYTDEDLANIRGNIDTNTFNSLTKSQNSAMNLALRQQATESMNNLRALQAKKLEIENSTLPEMQKAKLIQELAKAEHAEEMQLAKINFYSNSSALGWANFGLRADEAQRKAELDEIKKEVIKSLKGEGNETPATPKGGTTKTGEPKNKPKGRAF